MRNVLAFLVLVTSVGCGAPPDPAAPFIGTWMFSGGTLTMTCKGPPSVSQLMGNLTIKAGVSSALTVLDDSGCNVNYAISGNTATAVPGQSCDTKYMGMAAKQMPGALTIMTSDGKSATYAGSMSLTDPNSGDACSGTVAGSLNKSSK